MLEKKDFTKWIHDTYSDKNKYEFSDDLIDFQKSIFQRKPKDRPSFKKLLEHDWFKGRVEETFD